MTAFTDAERAFLSGQRIARLATAGLDGTPDVSAVGFHKARGPAELVRRPDHSWMVRITPRTVWSWGINDGATPRFAGVERRDG